MLLHKSLLQKNDITGVIYINKFKSIGQAFSLLVQGRKQVFRVGGADLARSANTRKLCLRKLELGSRGRSEPPGGVRGEAPKAKAFSYID